MAKDNKKKKIEIDPEAVKSALFNSKDIEESKFQIFLEQYKLYLGLTDKISERRQNANTYFLSINTGLCALLGYLFSNNVDKEIKTLLWIVPTAGGILSYFWFRMVKSYRDLNTAKFNVIHHIEEKLPISPYKAEWIALAEGKVPKIYTPFSHLEIYVPRSFIILYSFLLLRFFPYDIAKNHIVDVINYFKIMLGLG